MTDEMRPESRMSKFWIAEHESGRYVSRDHIDLVRQGGWLLTANPLEAMAGEEPIDFSASSPPFEKLYLRKIEIEENASEDQYAAAIRQACKR